MPSPVLQRGIAPVMFMLPTQQDLASNGGDMHAKVSLRSLVFMVLLSGITLGK